jgi:hypothetical protein
MVFRLFVVVITWLRTLLKRNWSGRGGQPGLALGEHDEGVEEVPAVFGGGG